VHTYSGTDQNTFSLDLSCVYQIYLDLEEDKPIDFSKFTGIKSELVKQN